MNDIERRERGATGGKEGRKEGRKEGELINNAVRIVFAQHTYRTFASFVHQLLEQTMDVYDVSITFIIQSCCSNNCRISRMN